MTCGSSCSALAGWRRPSKLPFQPAELFTPIYFPSSSSDFTSTVDINSTPSLSHTPSSVLWEKTLHIFLNSHQHNISPRIYHIFDLSAHSEPPASRAPNTKRHNKPYRDRPQSYLHSLRWITSIVECAFNILDNIVFLSLSVEIRDPGKYSTLQHNHAAILEASRKIRISCLMNTNKVTSIDSIAKSNFSKIIVG